MTVLQRWVQASRSPDYQAYHSPLVLHQGALYLDLSTQLFASGTVIGVTFSRSLAATKPPIGYDLLILTRVGPQAFEVLSYDGFLHFGDDYLLQVRAR